jgi:hypothetical protein
MNFEEALEKYKSIKVEDVVNPEWKYYRFIITPALQKDIMNFLYGCKNKFYKHEDCIKYSTNNKFSVYMIFGKESAEEIKKLY